MPKPTPDQEPTPPDAPKSLSQIGSEMAETWREAPQLNKIAMGCLAGTVLMLLGVGLLMVTGN